MQQISTSELLIKHLYNETNEAEAASVRSILANDTAMQQEFSRLQEAKNELDEAGGDIPGVSVIEKIKAFSKKQSLAEAH
ncbi:MAG: hypothetical protein U0X41_09740 [Chitinophagales bacterium]